MKTSFACFLIFGSQICFGQKPAIEIQPHGLKPDTAFFALGDKKVNYNSFPAATKLYLKLSAIKGFAVKDGKSFPGCSMKVINAANEVIIQYEDLFSDHPDGIDNSDARYINLTLTLGAPMKENQTYRWDSRVWDKLTKAELFVSAIVKVSSPKDLLGIKKESQGLTCENLFVLGDEPLTTNRVEDKQKLTFVFSGLKGFTLNSEKKVNLGASLIVKDANNFNLFEESDLFKDTTAYDPQRVETLYMYLTVGDPLLEGNVYTWHLKVWDKNSKKSISASVKLEVVK